MKTILKLLTLCHLLSALCLSASGQGTVFTYQGQVNDGGAFANGSYDLRFAIYDAASAGTQQGNLVTNSATAVSNGLFAVTLDFGNQFPGANRWLEIAVRTNGAAGFFTLSPRQPLTPAPYAIFAAGANASGLSGTIASNQLAASIGVWSQSGNNIFYSRGNVGVGTPVPASPLHVNTAVGQDSALRLTSGGSWPLVLNQSPSSIFTITNGGDARLAVLANGNVGIGTIAAQAPLNVAGGVTGIIPNPGSVAVFERTNNNYVSILAPSTNETGVLFGDTFNSTDGSIVFNNTAAPRGFQFRTSNNFTKMVLLADGRMGVGTINPATTLDVAGTLNATAYQGNGVGLTNINAVTLGGLSPANFWNTTGNAGTTPGSNFLGTTDNQALELQVGGVRALRIEPNGPAAANMIGGYSQNSATTAGVIGGGGTSGSIQIVSGIYGAVLGGHGNNAGTFGFIGGGAYNSATGSFSAVVCGEANVAGGYGSVVGGGTNNTSGGLFSTISGGSQNTATNSYGTIGGGLQNSTMGDFATVPGGDRNSATNRAFAAGHRARANTTGSFVWADSTDVDFASTAANQFLIRAGGGVGIGTASPTRELEVQNTGDTEVGIKSADASGHLWTLQSSADTGNDSFQIIDRTLNASRFYIGTNGFVGIGTSNPTNKLHVIGGISATVFVTTSDRNAKENFEPVSPTEVLDKVTALPITRWTFKEMPGQKHLGPMAQDFHDAFGLGAGETGIATVDESGVALAAIQGLNENVEVRSQKAEDRIQRLEAENAELKQRLDNLENDIRSQKSK